MYFVQIMIYRKFILLRQANVKSRQPRSLLWASSSDRWWPVGTQPHYHSYKQEQQPTVVNVAVTALVINNNTSVSTALCHASCEGTSQVEANHTEVW